jgi:hypothetical protein
MWHTSLGLLATGFFARSMAFCLSLHGGDGQLGQFLRNWLWQCQWQRDLREKIFAKRWEMV